MNIIYTNNEGLLCIVTPVPRDILERQLGPVTDSEYNHLITKDIPEDATGIRTVSSEDIPVDRTFRGAWRDITDEERVDIDCNAAKDIALERLRGLRIPALKKNDEEFLISQKTGGSTHLVEEKRKTLLGVTDSIKELDYEGVVNDDVAIENLKSLLATNEEIIEKLLLD